MAKDSSDRLHVDDDRISCDHANSGVTAIPPQNISVESYMRMLDSGKLPAQKEVDFHDEIDSAGTEPESIEMNLAEDGSQEAGFV